MEQPRVDPSDWASRRQNAVNRAKELRSKLKERENQTSFQIDVPAMSRADLQRQRRSRQLEETQRLLDGYGLNNFDDENFKPEAAANTTDDVVARRRAKQDNTTRDGRSSNLRDNADTHSVISREHLGQIHRKYTHSDVHEASSDGRNTKEYASLTKERNVTRNGTFVEAPTGESFVPNNISNSSLRERPLEGRGRGRGRGRIATASSHASSLGEMSQISRSNSNSREQTGSSRIKTVDQRNASISSEAVESYLRERRVPGYKEGECDKLAILRQRLVARREKRDNIEDKENSNVQTLPKSNSLNSSCVRDEIKVSKKSTREDVNSPVLLQNLSLNDEASVRPSSIVDESHSSRYSVTSRNNIMGADLDDEESVVEIELIECDFCKRSFAPKVYEKHIDQDGQPKCQTQMSKKRAVFNSAKARIANNDTLRTDEQMQVLQIQKNVAKELAKKKKSGGVSKKLKKRSKWQQESNALREAMKANRLIAKAEREGKPAHYYL